MRSTPAPPAISLAIIPFRNASGDPSLDWVGAYLAETLGTDIGQSSSLRTVSSDRVQQTLHDLQLTPSSNLDAATARRLAESSDTQTLVWGQYLRFGDQIRIDATLLDLERDHTVPLKAEAPNANAIPGAVDRLAQAIRENLALRTSVLKELEAQAFKPSSKSLPALRDYNARILSSPSHMPSSPRPMSTWGTTTRPKSSPGRLSTSGKSRRRRRRTELPLSMRGS